MVEEIITRWGALSFVLLGLRRAGLRDGFQLVNLAAAILFAAGHLPVFALFGARLTPWAVIFVLAGNSFAGMIFGWLFRKRGLESAMVAHAAADIWVQVGAPLLAVIK